METAQQDTTVVSLFATFGEAQNACSELVHSGFQPNDVHMITRGEGLDTGDTSDLAHAAERLRALQIPDDQVQIYQGELERGRTVLVVAAQRRSEQAATVVDSCGAINVNLRSEDDRGKTATHMHEYPFAETRHMVPNTPEQSGS
jgi:hypothetical protein